VSWLCILQAVASDGVATSAVQSAAEERLKLFGAYSLADPAFLALIPLGLAAFTWGRSRFGRDRGRIGALAARAIKPSLLQRLAWLPFVLQLAALTLVALALARPLRGSVEYTSESEGVDIALVIDRSGSMEHKDLDPKLSRLDVVKQVVEDFAVRRMTDRAGAADNLALITFAHYPELLCPFTLDVDAITGFIRELKFVQNRAEDGTGIGVGLSKAVAVLKETSARSKVVVLLTDGENNIDVITPLDAADLAAREKIKVYTIFAGRYVFTMDVFGRQVATEREIDTNDLQEIAKRTGGRFFRARDKHELEAVYAEIERLERTKREEKRFSETYDLYTWFLLPALACYALAWLSYASWARRLP
jgi:Ca-activated chloride channel homolog